MKRILCPECGKVKPTPPDDAAQGLFTRYVSGKARGYFNCDLCNKPIDPGDEVVCTSTPLTISNWELEYITL